MLTVEDDEFWDGVEPVVFGSLPQLQDAVTVVGYPIGGDTMSVTSGVVSRIEVTSYVHGAAELLGIQIDAAEPVIAHFINDYERNGQYTGFPCLGVEWQKLENPDLRQALLMRPQDKGVLIRRVEPTAPLHQHVSQYDILLSFDGIDIANDGTVPFRSGERISFSYLVSQVKSLNGTKVRNMQHLVQLVDSCEEQYLHFDLDYNQKEVLPKQQLKAQRVPDQTYKPISPGKGTEPALQLMPMDLVGASVTHATLLIAPDAGG
eukprot:gene10689-10847_t